MPQAAWYWITAWGDAAVMVPCAAVIALWLLGQGARSLLGRWLLRLLPGQLTVAGSKVAYLVWGVGLPGLAFRGISGHAFDSALVLPVLAWLLAGLAGSADYRVAWALGWLLAVLVAVSRVVLGFHFSAEVVIGCALGGLLSFNFIQHAALARFNPRPTLALLLCLGLIVLAQHGKRAGTDEMVGELARTVAAHR